MKTFLTLFSLILSMSLFAQEPNHENWSALLKKHVSSSGKVSYKGFKGDLAKLDAYIEDLKDHSPKSSWKSNEKKAYWINAYNAFTVKLILDNYPTKSIKSLKFNGKSAWDHKWIEIGGATLSLNDIENSKLRSGFNDPRVHFLINCASYSCPILLNKAVTGNNVDYLLTQQTKKFLADKTRNKISADKVEISELFNWYSSDFGNIIEFINKYSDTKVKSDATVKYLTYNWNINE